MHVLDLTGRSAVSFWGEEQNKSLPADCESCSPFLRVQELGAKRVKAALSCSDDAVFIRDHLLPFLDLLGCDALGRGTCREPLIELVQTIYTVSACLA